MTQRRPRGRGSADPLLPVGDDASLIARPRELVAVEDARLVGLDDRGLGQRVALPLAHPGVREQRGEIRARGALRRDAVGLEPEGDRRVERVGERERAAEERPAGAEALPALVPDLGDARDVGGEVGRPRPHVDPLAYAHRHLVAQRAEARMHLGATSAPRRARARRPATCPGAARRGTRRSRASPRRRSSPSCRHGHARRRREAPPVRVVDARAAAPCAPRTAMPESLVASQRAQRPRRVVLVAEVERVHGVMSEGNRLAGVHDVARIERALDRAHRARRPRRARAAARRACARRCRARRCRCRPSRSRAG